MAVYIGWVHILLVLFVCSFYWRWAAVTSAVLCGSVFLPVEYWDGLLRNGVFVHWRKYLRYSYLFEENISPYNKYIFASFPHGACPLGAILCGTANDTFWPEFNGHCHVASFIFRVPGWRHMHSWMSAYPATRADICRMLSGFNNRSIWRNKARLSAACKAADDLVSSNVAEASYTGSSSSSTSSASSDCGSVGAEVHVHTADSDGAFVKPPPAHPSVSHLSHLPVISSQPTHRTQGRDIGVLLGIFVGGISELFLCGEDKEVVVLKERKGFVRIAVEHGAYLMPTYFFGHSTFLRFGPRWLRNLSRKVRMTFGFMYGPFGLPIPFRQDIYVVNGRPVPVEQMDPSDPRFNAYVDEVHAEFMARLEKLYYDHREEYGWGNRELLIT